MEILTIKEILKKNYTQKKKDLEFLGGIMEKSRLGEFDTHRGRT